MCQATHRNDVATGVEHQRHPSARETVSSEVWTHVRLRSKCLGGGMQSGTQRQFLLLGVWCAPHLLFGLRHLLQVEAECTDIEGRPQHEEEACGCDIAVAREGKPVGLAARPRVVSASASHALPQQTASRDTQDRASVVGEGTKQEDERLADGNARRERLGLSHVISPRGRRQPGHIVLPLAGHVLRLKDWHVLLFSADVLSRLSTQCAFCSALPEDRSLSPCWLGAPLSKSWPQPRYVHQGAPQL